MEPKLPFKFNGPLIVQKRCYLSYTLIHKAAALAKEASKYEINEILALPIEQRPHLKHQGAVIAAVILAVSFLESHFNEFIANIFTDGKKQYPDLCKIPELINRWRKKAKIIERKPVIQKYQWIITTVGKQKLAESSKIYTNVDKLRRLRNYVVHHKPEPVTVIKWDLNRHVRVKHEKHEFDKAFEGLFPENPLTGGANPFFPDKCLGHGCAEWSVKSALALIHTFYERLEIEPNMMIDIRNLDTR